jgi:hypothetical protein
MVDEDDVRHQHAGLVKQPGSEPEPPRPAPPPPDSIAIDKATLDIARAAAATPWYASGAVGIALVLGPPLFFIDGHLAGQGLSVWADALTFFYAIFGVPCLFLPWLALFFLHRYRAHDLRVAIARRRAWRLKGSVRAVGRKAITIGGRTLTTIRAARIPRSAENSTCEVVFADARITNPQTLTTDGVVISITGPDGRFLYPRLGALPSLLRLPAIVASAAIAFGFTASCNGQAQAYDGAATRLREIQAAVPCTDLNKPGDACRRWVDGTVQFTGSSSVEVGAGSACSVVLRWRGAQQAGDIRTSLGDCSQQLSTTPMPAKIALVRNYATEVFVGQTLYQTDQWPQVAWPVLPLDLLFRVAAFLWLVWPVAHIAVATVYRLRRLRSHRPAGTPSPPVPALGSTS